MARGSHHIRARWGIVGPAYWTPSSPIVAGIIEMDFGIFMLYNVIGSVLWSIGVTVLGYFVGQYIPDKYFEPILLLIVILSFIPAIVEVLRSQEHREKIHRILLRKK